MAEIEIPQLDGRLLERRAQVVEVAGQLEPTRRQLDQLGRPSKGHP